MKTIIVLKCFEFGAFAYSWCFIQKFENWLYNIALWINPQIYSKSEHLSLKLTFKNFFLLVFLFFPFFIFSFIYISWRLVTLQYSSGFCHTLVWISHGFTCVPHPEPPSHLLPHPIPLGHPSAPALNTCLIHQTWTGNLFHNW